MLLENYKVLTDLFIFLQISHKRVENPKDVLKVGQEVTVKVLDVNADAERVSLSIKALEERPAQEDDQKKNVNHVLVVKTSKKNVTLNFQKLKLDFQWLTYLVILNYNQIKVGIYHFSPFTCYFIKFTYNKIVATLSVMDIT